MSLSFQMRSGAPAGTYPAEFVRAEEYTEHSQYPPGLRLTFKITEGELAGSEATRICSRRFSPRSNLFKFATALKGDEIKPGETVDIEAFLGTKGQIVVAETGSGSRRVESFTKDT